MSNIAQIYNLYTYAQKQQFKDKMLGEKQKCQQALDELTSTPNKVISKRLQVIDRSLPNVSDSAKAGQVSMRSLLLQQREQLTESPGTFIQNRLTLLNKKLDRVNSICSEIGVKL